MVGGQSNGICGSNKKICADEDYPVCDPPAQNEVWIGKQRIVARDSKTKDSKLASGVNYEFIPEDKAIPDGVRALRMDNPETPDVNENELTKLISSEYLERRGFAGVCRSMFAPFSWWAYKARGAATYLAYYNQTASANGKEVKGLKIKPAEMVALAEALGLNEDNACLKKGFPPKMENGVYTKGTYIFSVNYDWLITVIPILEDEANSPIPGLSHDTRMELTAHLNKLLENTPMRVSAKEQGGNLKLILAASFGSAVVGPFLMWVLMTGKYKEWVGQRVKSDDMRAEIQSRIDADPGYHVKGLQEKARRAWRQVDNPQWRNIIVEGPSGAGKDMLTEEMINLLIRGDESVPEGFKNAFVFKVTPNMLQKNTMYRGSVADNVADLFTKAVKKSGGLRGRKAVIVFEEIDQAVLSGKTSEGGTEQVSMLLLAEIRRKTVQDNVIIIGTTARSEQLKLAADNLIRRFRWTYKAQDPLSIVISNLDGPEVKKIENYYKKSNIKIPKNMIELAGKLTEVYYRPTTMQTDPSSGKITNCLARYDAILGVLSLAAQHAKDTKSKAVLPQHVIAAVNELSQGKAVVEKEKINELMSKPADELMIDDKTPLAEPEIDYLARARESDMQDSMLTLKNNDPNFWNVRNADELRNVAETIQRGKEAGQFSTIMAADGTIETNVLLHVAQALMRIEKDPNFANAPGGDVAREATRRYVCEAFTADANASVEWVRKPEFMSEPFANVSRRMGSMRQGMRPGGVFGVAGAIDPAQPDPAERGRLERMKDFILRRGH